MARDFPTAVYVISVAAELAGVHPQTLRIYERKGLVAPARTGGGSRRYSDEDIALLRRIQELTDDGLNLAGVKKVLRLESEVKELQSQINYLEVMMDDGETRAAKRKASVPVERSLTLYVRPDKPR